MELTSLKFSAETDELSVAIQKLQLLTKVTEELNTANKNKVGTDKETATAAAALAKAVEAQNKATGETAETTRKNVSVLERQKDILAFMTEGFSRGQASTLAMAKAAGALGTELKDLGSVLQTQRKLIGGDPFDKSTSGLLALQNQYTELKEAVRQYNADSSMTAKQAKELARDKERLIEKLKVEGASFTDIKNAIREHNAAYNAAAESVNRLVIQEKEIVRVQREHQNAIRAVNKEEERMEAMLASLGAQQSTNIGFARRAAEEEARYARNLKLSGISAEEAAAKLQVYRKGQQALAAEEEKKQALYLQRGLQPQIGDIAVSLASGQNPLTVMLQQGDQIRGLIAQTGVQGAALQKAMREAMSGTVESIKMTAGAMVNLLGGAITSTAGAITGLVTGPFKAFIGVMKETDANARGMGTAFDAFKASVGALNMAILSALPTLLIAAGVATVALGIATFQTSKQQDQLSKSLILTGASLGLSTTGAINLASSMETMGVSTSRSMDIISAFAKEGQVNLSQMASIIPVVSDAMQYLGISADDMAKNYSKIAKDPVAALADLGRETGLVSEETLRMVAGLVESGKKTEAVAAAIQAANGVYNQAAKDMQREYSLLGTIFNETGKFFREFWDGVKGLTYKPTALEKLKTDYAEVNEKIKETADNMKSWEKLGIKTDPKLLNQLKDQAESIRENVYLMEKAASVEATNRAQASKDMQATKLALEIDKQANDTIDKLNMKMMTRNEYVQKYLDKIKEQKGEEAFAKANLGTLTKAAELEWQRTTAAKNARKEINHLEKAYQSDLAVFINLREEALGKTQELTRAEIKYNEVLASKDYASFTPDQKEALRIAKDQAVAAEKLQSYLKEEKKLKEELIKYDDRREALIMSLNVEYAKSLENVQKESDALALRLAVLGQTEEESKKITIEAQRQAKIREADAEFAIKQLEIWQKFVKAQGNTEGATFDIEGYERAIAQADEVRKQKQINANREVAVKAAEDFDKEFRAIKSGISDSLVTALFEGGKAGRKKLRDVIVAELKKPVTLVVNALVNTMMNSVAGGITNAIMGGVAGSAAGSAAGSMGGSALGAAAGTAFMGSSFGMGLTAGFSALAGEAGIAGALSAGATSIGAGSVMSGIGTIVGALGPIALGLAAVYAIVSSMDDSGTLHTGATSSYSAAGGTKSGITLAGDKMSTAAFGAETAKVTSGIAQSIVQMLDSTAATFGKEAGFAAATGFADDTSKDGAWGSLMISNAKGNNVVNWADTQTSRWAPKEFADGEEGMKQYLAAVAADVKNAIVGMDIPDWAKSMVDKLGNAPGLDELAKVVDQINASQEALKMLGNVMPAFSNLSDEAATALLNIAGSASNLMQTSAAYYNNFFTADEKAKKSTEALAKSLNELGVAMPVDRLAYRVEVEKALKDGNEELAYKLMQLSGVFADLNPVLDSITDSGQAVSDVMKSLQEDAANLGIELLQVQGKTVEANAAIRALAIDGMTAAEVAMYDSNQTLRVRIDTLKAEAAETERVNASLKSLATENTNLNIQMMELQGNTTGAQAAMKALATEGMTAVEIAAWDANQTLKGMIADMQASQQAAAQAAQEAAAKAKGIADEKYNLETRLLQAQGDTAKLRERELATLDPTNQDLLKKIWAQEEANAAAAEQAKQAEEQARAMQQAAEAQARASEQLKQAWQSITDSIYAEVARIRALANPNAAQSLVSAQANFNAATAKARSGDQEAAKSLPELSKLLLELGGQQAKSLVELRRLQMQTAASLEQTGGTLTKQYGLVPAFASGGSYSGGLALVGESGPELINFSSGGTVHNASSTSAMLSNDYLCTLVEKLNENIDGLRYEVRADVSHNAKVAKILDRVVKDGETISISVLTPLPVDTTP